MKQKNFFRILIFTLIVCFSSKAQTISDDFEDGDISGWIEGTTSDWTNSTSSPITGSRSLKHNLSSVADESYIYHDISSLDFSTQNISWQFNIANGSWDPSGSNKFLVYLTSNETNLSSSTVDGYAVGVNLTGTSDILTLWKVTNGAADGAIVTSSFDWGSSDTVGIKVTRSITGEWELLLDTDGGFDSLSSAGTATNTDYTHDDYFGLSFEFTSSRAGLLRMDDVTVEGTAPSSDPTITFDSSSSTENETDATFSTSIPVTLTNYDSDVTISVTVDGSSTAEGGDYTLNTTSLIFDANETLNISLDINDDADEDDETVILNIAVSSGTADLGTSQHTITITDDDLPQLVISEIMYNTPSTDDEWIEIYNNNGTSVDISDWTIEYNSSTLFTFPGSTSIADGTYITIAVGSNGDGTYNNDNSFIPDYSSVVDPIATTTDTNNLGNTSGTITLKNDNGNTVNEVEYDDGDAGGNTDGGGSSFELTDLIADNSDTGTNWQASAFNGGSPGKVNSTTWSGTTNDWNTSGNWSAGVPTTTSDVSIPSGLSFYPTVSSVVTINSITIASGATLKATNTFTTSSVTYNRTLANSSQWYLISSPVVGETYDAAWATANSIPTSSLDTDNIGISWYDNTSSDVDEDGGGSDTATGHWRYLQTNDSNSGTFTSGNGYGIIRSSSGTISFTGTGINTSSQTTTITYGASNPNNYNLVGNPFISFLNLGSFFTSNNAANLIGGTVWFWNGSSYDAKMSGIVDDTNFNIASGQGFFVEAGTAATTSDNLSFDISGTDHNSSDTFQKLGNTESSLYVNIGDGSNNRYAKIYYIEGATKGFDNGFDGKLFGGIDHSFAIYSNLLDDKTGNKYQVQSLPKSDFENMQIPLGVIANANKEIVFTAEALNFPSGIKVYLEDKLTNTFTRLDEVNSEYKVTLLQALDGTGRFYLHTTSQVLSTEDSIINNSISMYSNKKVLHINGLDNTTNNVSVFNLLGKQLINKTYNDAGNKTISLSSLVSGVYFVKLENSFGSLTKKIILE